jgi:hypothetical protein
LENAKTIESEELDPWSLFLYAMKAPMTKDRYKSREAKFFDFIGLGDDSQTVEEKARVFANKGKEDLNWAFTNILKFIHFQKERVDRKEIHGARQGWIALAAVIFGRWRPFWIVLGALVYGMVNATALGLQSLGTTIPFRPYFSTRNLLQNEPGRKLLSQLQMNIAMN